MSLTLNLQQAIPHEWKGVIREKVEEARQALASADTDSEKHEAVHTARKCFKKIRAALRLVRDDIDFYKEENVFFRDLGRDLSHVRDSTSRLVTLDALYNTYKARLYKDSFKELENALLEHRQALAEHAWKENALLSEVEKKLKLKTTEIEEWPMEIADPAPLKAGLKRVYKRGKSALEVCRQRGEPEDFHEWRKRAKYLRYQLRMLYEAWPPILDKLEDELHIVTDLLGEDHDLVVLKNWMKNQQFSFSNDEESELFEALSNHHSNNLRSKAIIRGRRIYFEAPSHFSKRLATYWQQACDLNRLHP